MARVKNNKKNKKTAGFKSCRSAFSQEKPSFPIVFGIYPM